jgi:hypothetical protein
MNGAAALAHMTLADAERADRRSILRSFSARVAIAAVGGVVAEIGQIAAPSGLPWLTALGLIILVLGGVLAAARIGQAQRERDPAERSMWVLLGILGANLAATWLYLPTHLNGDEWMSISTIHGLCASGAYDSGPCTASAIDLSWLIGVAGVALGGLTVVIGWFITGFSAADDPGGDT